MSTLHEAYLQGRINLKNLPFPDLDARVLLCECASIPEEQFFISPDKKLTKIQRIKFKRLIKKRQRGFPLAYLTGKKEFWSLAFEVNPGVLIPRPETELVVRKVIELSSEGEKTIADIGTGCGNISVCLAKELPEAGIVASDISRKALRTARWNAKKHKTGRIEFYRGFLFTPLRKLGLENRCDFIVSNPPYISEAEWSNLSPEIREHEPKESLVAGETGLECITELINGAVSFLKSGGFLVFEVGAGQSARIQKSFASEWTEVRCFDDLNGIPRVFVARKA